MLLYICSHILTGKDKSPKIKEESSEEIKNEDRPKVKSRDRTQESPNFFEWIEDMVRQGRYNLYSIYGSLLIYHG